jgi:hypothetical protein
MEKAILAGDIDTLVYLLKEGHDPNGITEEETPYLFVNDNPEVQKTLLQYGANPDVKDQYGFSLSDYTGEEMVAPLNTIIMTPTKFIQYRGTKKNQKRRGKTRKAKQSGESS